MSWDFSTDEQFQAKLDWVAEFVRDEVEPLDMILGNPFDKSDQQAQQVTAPLREKVRSAGLWATHLGPELGGQGYGQVKLALLNEILGRSRWAPSLFGCQAPDSGNAEVLAHYGTAEQKARYLQPLLDGEISSTYSMTEPQAGADPTLLTTRAVREGDEWIITGEKWFSSNASFASFFLVMVVTDPDANRHRGMSMFIVPADAPGLRIVRNVGLGGEQAGHGTHGYIRYEGVRVPRDHMLGEQGQAFSVAQTRLGGGRIHHAMRTVAQARRALDMMCERALSRRTAAGSLADFGVVQADIADSWIEIEQFRLLVLRTAWLLDQAKDYRAVRKDIAAVKIAMPGVYHRVVQKAMHLHGALGMSNEMPFFEMLINSEAMGIVDGPTEVHRVTLAREVLKAHSPVDSLFPSGHLPSRYEAARRQYAHLIEHSVGNS